MRRRLAMSALAVLFTTGLVVGSNVTAADAATSATTGFVMASDLLCC